MFLSGLKDFTIVKPPRTLLSWSSGKDAAWTLHTLRQSGAAQVVALITTVNREFDRVAMHAVRRDLLEMQAKAVGLPLVVVPLPWPCTNEQYELAMMSALDHARIRYQVSHVAFGDLFLEDVRGYREKQLEAFYQERHAKLASAYTRFLEDLKNAWDVDEMKMLAEHHFGDVVE